MDLKVLYFNQMLNVINRENKIIATNAWLLGRLSAPPDERKAALLIDFHILSMVPLLLMKMVFYFRQQFQNFYCSPPPGRGTRV